MFACTINIVIVRFCKFIYLLGVQINSVRLCEFLYVLSIKGSKYMDLLILKRLMVVKVSTCTKKCVSFIYLRTALLYFMTQRVMTISSRLFFWTTWHFKRGPIGVPETSVRNYHSLLRNNPAERSYYLLHEGILKSRTKIFLTTPLQLIVFTEIR